MLDITPFKSDKNPLPYLSYIALISAFVIPDMKLATLASSLLPILDVSNPLADIASIVSLITSGSSGFLLTSSLTSGLITISLNISFTSSVILA